MSWFGSTIDSRRRVAAACLWLGAAALACPAAVAAQPAVGPAGESDLEADLAAAATPAELTAAELEALGAAAAADSSAAAASKQAAAVGAAPSSAPQISLIFDGAAAAYTDAKPLQTGGHDPKRNGFNLQQLELHMESSVDPYLHFQANIVFAQFGVEVEEAYAETMALPWGLQLKAGQMLTAFGRINATHPHSWSFVDQPLMIGKFFGSEGSRGLGVQAAWLTPLPWFTEVKLATTDAAGQCCARSWLGGTDLPVRRPGDLLYTLTAKSFVPIDDDWSVTIGLSGQTGPNASGNDNRSEVVGADLYLRYRPASDPLRRSLSLQVEHSARSRQQPGTHLVDQAGYAHLVGVFALRWEAGWRTDWGTGVSGDPLDASWTGQRTRHAAQLSFYPSHFSRVRLQLSADVPSWRQEPIYGAVLALETLIGDHGAHNF